MSTNRVTVDLVTLPAALLQIAKWHLRVEGVYDDALITSMIARAIGKFEQCSGAALNVATWEWTPDQARFCNNRAPVPITPVTAFTAAAGATDVSASYTITTNSVFGVPILHLNGAWQSCLVLTLQTGFTVETLPPPVLDEVLSMTAHLHNHREILIPGTEFVRPDLALDATWWVPRI